jgi:hypothetical protein
MSCSVFSEHSTYALFCIYWTFNICLVLYLLNIQHSLVLYLLNIQHMSCSVFTEQGIHVCWIFSKYKTRHVLNVQKIQNKTYVECSVNTEQDICWMFSKYRTRHMLNVQKILNKAYVESYIQHMSCSVFLNLILFF